MKNPKPKISNSFRLLIMVLSITQWSGVQFGYDFPQIFESVLIKTFKIEAAQVGLLYTVSSAPNLFINIVAAMLIASIGLNVSLPIFQSAVFLGNSLVFLAVRQRSYRLLLAGRVFLGIGFDLTYLGMAMSVEKWFSGGSFTLAFGLGRSICYLMGAIAAFFLPQIYLETRNLENSVMVLVAYSVLIFTTTSIYSVLDLSYGHLTNDPVQKPSTKEVSGGKSGEEGEGEGVEREEENPLKPEKKFTIRHLRYVSPKAWLLFGMTVGFSQMYYQFTNTGTDLFQIRFGLTYEEAKNCMAILPLLNAALIPVFSVFYGKFGKKTIGMWIGSLLAVATYLYMATIPSTNSGYHPYVAVGLISLFFCTFCSCLLSSLVMSVPKQAAGLFVALVATLQNLLLTTLPLFFSLFYGPRTDQAYQNTLYVLASFSAIMCCLAFFFFIADTTGDRMLTMPESDPRVLKIQQKMSVNFLESALTQTRPKTENATMAAPSNMWESAPRSYVSQDGVKGRKRLQDGQMDEIGDGFTSKCTQNNMTSIGGKRGGDEYQRINDGLGSGSKHMPNSKTVLKGKIEQ